MKMELLEITDRRTREELIIDLYQRCFPTVSKFIREHGGTLEDAKDIFQDALIAFYENELSGRLSITTTDEAYIIGIARKKWFKKYRSLKNTLAIDQVHDLSEPSPASLSRSKLLLYLQATGKRCLDLLRAFYYDNQTLEEIRDQFNFSSQHSASVQKYKCLEKVRERVKEKMISYEDFIE